MPSPTAAAGAGSVRALFVDRFGREPDVIASSPGRVNLIGEHTDYNGGEVLPIAIARRTWVAAGKREGSLVPTLRAVSATHPSMGTSALGAPTRSGEWWDYLTGVAAPLVALSESDTSLDLAVMSDVPAG